MTQFRITRTRTGFYVEERVKKGWFGRPKYVEIGYFPNLPLAEKAISKRVANYLNF